MEETAKKADTADANAKKAAAASAPADFHFQTISMMGMIQIAISPLTVVGMDEEGRADAVAGLHQLAPIAEGCYETLIQGETEPNLIARLVAAGFVHNPNLVEM